ncbi:c-type cytochrome [Hyphomonas jannaschiana]|uniref:TdcF protein n=1 Tax=Hyphomonas jannaschiana VP2 TaxID=1280952 RepID=A0A059F9I9_9PROT|nr:cytochrome c [Hyphomonas jannaschiana]KCZ87226.1 TdcF protein [Hyphomonas jannaschiana VP2]
MRHQTRFPRTALTALAFAAAALTMHADEGIPEVTSFEPTPLEQKIFDGPGVTVTRGEDIYSTLCAGCHMPEGEGAVGGGMYPALAGNEKLEYPDYAVFIVLNGYKAMPSFAHTLSDEQVAAVVNYLQSGLGGNSYEPAATVEQAELSRPQ